jgi:hypothetical protein
VEVGLGRARLALAEDFFSLQMIRSTQGWSGGAQSWWPLSVVNLELEARQNRACEHSFLEGSNMKDRDWGLLLGTCFRDFLEELDLTRRRGIR